MLLVRFIRLSFYLKITFFFDSIWSSFILNLQTHARFNDSVVLLKHSSKKHDWRGMTLTQWSMYDLITHLQKTQFPIFITFVLIHTWTKNV